MAPLKGNSTNETSPLLVENSEPPGERSDGRIQTETNSRTDAKGNGTFETTGKPVTGGDDESLERQNREDTPQPEYEGLPEVRKKMKYIMPALAIGIFMVSADQTLIVSSYGRIGSELDALNLTSWIATAYFMTLTAFQPLYGKLSDIFGRKPLLLWGFLVFGLGCVFCGLAQDITQLIIARAIAGVGGAAVVVVMVVLLSDIVPLRERGVWQGYINITHAFGSSLGAPLGGALADSVGWRWAFLAQGPLCLIGFTAVFFALHLPKLEETDWKTKLRRIDILGAVTLITAVFLGVLGLDRVSNVGWKNTVAIVSISISIPLFLFFGLVEAKISREPIAPVHVIVPRSMLSAFLCNFFASATWFAALFYISLYWQVVNDISATQAGLRLVPAILLTVIGSLSAGFYMKKTGQFANLARLATVFLLIGSIALLLTTGLIPALTSTPLAVISVVICGTGMGVGITTYLIALLAHAGRADQAVATACSYLFRSLGTTTGVAAAATAANRILRDRLASELPRLGLSDSEAASIAARVRESLSALKDLEPRVREVVVRCYADGARGAFVVQVVLAAGAVVASLWLRQKVLSY